jgi:pantoate--beta-alanine ligase
MKVFYSIQEFRDWRTEIKGTLGFVPTMGNLHRGHASLVKRSVESCDQSVVSIFVNPTQFNSSKDFETYPKTLDQDLKMLREVGVAAVFAPSALEMYPQGFVHKVVRAKDEQRILCDAKRPGHFDGVLTVVAKLFSIVQPTQAFFGEKDFQQFRYIVEMTEDLFFNLQLVPCATEREPSGLALSSRNGRLTDDAKAQAAKVWSWICKEQLNSSDLSARLQAHGMELEYLEDHWGRRFVAFWIEGVRLIDNFVLGDGGPKLDEVNA